MRIAIPFEFMGEEYEIDTIVEYTTDPDYGIEIEQIEIFTVNGVKNNGDYFPITPGLAHIIGSFASKFLNDTSVSIRTNEEIAKIVAEEMTNKLTM